MDITLYNNNIKLSVIIPLYNSFGILIHSLKQYEKSIIPWVEFVIVDDCSTDGSYEKALEYVKNSTLNIALYKNDTNCGPGITRNNAIKKSKGEYITFMDSDDYFDASFWNVINNLLNGINECVIFDANIVYKNGNKTHIKMIQSSTPYNKISKEEILVFLRGAPWGKIYRKDIIVNNGIVFLNQKRNEDTPFTKTAISFCGKIECLNIPLYNYVQYQNSLVHKKSLRDYNNAINAFNYMNSMISDNYWNEKEAIFIIELLYANAVLTSYSFSRKKWVKHIDKIENLYPKYMCNMYLSKFSFRYRLFVSLISKRMFFTFKLLLAFQNLLKRIYR